MFTKNRVLITPISVLLPPISQYFSKELLSTPIFGDDNEKSLLYIFKYIEENLLKKLNKTPGKKVKCEELIKEFKEIYAQIRQKKDFKAKEKNKTEMPFYFFKCARRSSEKLLRRLKYKGISGALKYRRSNDL